MPCLVGHFDPKIGVGLQVIVTPPDRSPCDGAMPPSATPRLALIDTGTTTTIITPQVVQELGLHPTGKRRSLVGTMQSGPVDTYCVTLVPPATASAEGFRAAFSASARHQFNGAPSPCMGTPECSRPSKSSRHRSRMVLSRCSLASMCCVVGCLR